MRLLMTTVALAALAASPAFAQSSRHVNRAASDAYAYAYAYAMQDSDTVVVNGQIVGRDPDINVRLSLRRDPMLQAN